MSGKTKTEKDGTVRTEQNGSLNYEFMHYNSVFKDVHERRSNVSSLVKQHALLENEWLFLKDRIYSYLLIRAG